MASGHDTKYFRLVDDVTFGGKGDPGVSMGTYATILFVMGMTERLADLADATSDSVGLQLEEENLPQRIRSKKRKRREV